MILTALQIAEAEREKRELTLNVYDLLDTIHDLQARCRRRELEVDELCVMIDGLYVVYHSKLV
jgi:hypothetical protein